MTTTSAACTKMRRAAAAIRSAKALDARPGAVRVPECTNASHDAIKRNPAAWARLTWRGLQDTFDGRGTKLEMRNCFCGSTLCLPVSEAA